MAEEKEKVRATFDLTMRCLAQTFPADIALLSLGTKPDSVEVLSSDLPATERRGDWLAKATVGPETGLLQVEFQTEYSESKLWDSLDYRIQARRRYGLPVFSVLILLTDESYPGQGKNRLEETAFGHRQLLFEFQEIRLWELDVKDVLREGAPGLVPLAALARGQTKEEPLNLAVEAATKIKDNRIKSDLFAAIAVLGSLRYSPALIFSLIRRETMKESPIAQEFIREGLEKGREEGLLMGRIVSCQRFLKRPVTPLPELQKVPLEGLRRLAERLEAEVESSKS